MISAKKKRLILSEYSFLPLFSSCLPHFGTFCSEIENVYVSFAKISDPFCLPILNIVLPLQMIINCKLHFAMGRLTKVSQGGVGRRRTRTQKLIQMSNKIRHSGVVDGVEPGCVHVRILQSSACSACKVAAHCNASETKEKLVDVQVADASLYSPGDSVVVVADAAVGFRACLYGYLLPLILMVGALMAVLGITRSEGWAALSAIGVLIPYYIVLFLCRGRLRKNLCFAIER